MNHNTDKHQIAEITLQLDTLEQRRQQAIANAPQLHRVYLRAMYDEWSKIVPDLTEHIEKRYQNEVAAL